MKANETNILPELNIKLKKKFILERTLCGKETDSEVSFISNIQAKTDFLKYFHKKLGLLILIAIELKYTCSEKKRKALIFIG